MLNVLRKTVPTPIKKQVRHGIKFVKYSYRKHAIALAVQSDSVEKIIVGAAETYQAGWYSTNEQWLDITKRDDWGRVFKNQACLTHIVAEHVFEHLHYEEAQNALAAMFAYLKPGGRVRIAVPDGLNPNAEYIKHVGICGIGDDAADHKQLLTCDVLGALIEEAGFEVAHIEGYTAQGELLQVPYSCDDGYIMRSRVHVNEVGNSAPWSFPDAQTSLLMDGIKPDTK